MRIRGDSEPDAMPHGPMRRLVHDVIHYLPAAVIPGLLSLFSAVIFTRLFAPAQYGLYSLTAAAAGPIIDIVTQWIIQPAVRFRAEYELDGRAELFRNTTVTSIVFLTGALVFAGSGILVALALTGKSTDQLLLIAGAVSLVVTRVPVSIILPILRGGLQVVVFRRVTLALSLLSLVIPLALIRVAGTNVAWLLWGQAIAALTVAPYAFRASQLRLAALQLRMTRDTLETLRRFLRYGIPMMLWFVGSNFLSVEDRYVIGFFRGAREVGIYSANYNLVSGTAGLLNLAVSLAAGPIIYYQWGRGQKAEVENTIARMTEAYLILALAFVGGVYAVGTGVAALALGTRFHSGSDILVPVAIGVTLFGASVIGHKGLELGEQTRVMADNALVAAAINLALNLMLVPFFGYRAAAYVTTASYAVYSGQIWWQTRHHIPWHVDLSAVMRYCFYAVAAAATAAGLSALSVFRHPWSQVTIGTLAFCCVYCSLLLLFSRRHVQNLLDLPRTHTA